MRIDNLIFLYIANFLVILILSSTFKIFMRKLLVMQPYLFIYHWRSCCWNLGIHRLDGLCLLFLGNGFYIIGTCTEGKVFRSQVFWFLEPGHLWWIF